MSLADRVWNPRATTGGPSSAVQVDIWNPGDPIPPTGDWLLIGVASWSGYDRRLVSLIESLTRAPGRIALFDADVCDSQESVRVYIPRIGFVHHTPIVGHWHDGALVESDNGYAARHLIYRVLGLDPKSADEYVLQRPTGAAV
jgi:hypothetical protein